MMVLKPEQERVRTLLVDTITLLCRNGLSFKTEFNINALIGITLDKEDIFLVDIRETIKNAAAAAAEEEAAAESSPAKKNKRTESTNSKGRKRRKHSSRGDFVDASESDAETESSSTAGHTSHERNNSTTESSSKEPTSKRLIKQEMFEQMNQDDQPEEQQPLIVKPEPGYRQRSCDNNEQHAFDSSIDSIAGPSSWDPGQQQNVPTNSNQQGQVYFPFGGTSGKGQRKKSYATSYKLEVVAFAQSHSKEATARHFGIDSKTVRDWCKAKAQLEAAPATRKRLKGGGRKPQLVELEEALMLWMADQWSLRVQLTCRMIKEKAKQLFHSGAFPCPPTFVASTGWLQKFLNRQGIKLGRDLQPLNIAWGGEMLVVPPVQYGEQVGQVEYVSFFDHPHTDTKPEMDTGQDMDAETQAGPSESHLIHEPQSQIHSQQESYSRIPGLQPSKRIQILQALHSRKQSQEESQLRTLSHQESESRIQSHQESHLNTQRHQESHLDTQRHQESHLNTQSHQESHSNIQRHQESESECHELESQSATEMSTSDGPLKRDLTSVV